MLVSDIQLIDLNFFAVTRYEEKDLETKCEYTTLHERYTDVSFHEFQAFTDSFLLSFSLQIDEYLCIFQFFVLYYFITSQQDFLWILSRIRMCNIVDHLMLRK